MLIAAGGISSDGIIAIGTIAGVAVTILVAFNAYLKDRSDKRDGLRAKEAEEDEVQTAQYEGLKATVEHLALVMVGRPASDGLPAVRGFVDEQRDWNRKMELEITDANGGGTLRGSVQTLRKQVSEIQRTKT